MPIGALLMLMTASGRVAVHYFIRRSNFTPQHELLGFVVRVDGGGRRSAVFNLTIYLRDGGWLLIVYATTNRGLNGYSPSDRFSPTCSRQCRWSIDPSDIVITYSTLSSSRSLALNNSVVVNQLKKLPTLDYLLFELDWQASAAAAAEVSNHLSKLIYSMRFRDTNAPLLCFMDLPIPKKTRRADELTINLYREPLNS